MSPLPPARHPEGPTPANGPKDLSVKETKGRAVAGFSRVAQTERSFVARSGTMLLRMTVAVALLGTCFGVGCRRAPQAAPADAVQQGFQQGDLTARQSHGRRVFERRCATCHGPEGHGDGQNAYNLQPPPPDFQESLPELPVADRRAVIEGGTAALGRSALCPPWGRSLLDEEVDAVLAYMEVMAQPGAEDDTGEAPGRRGWRRRARP